MYQDISYELTIYGEDDKLMVAIPLMTEQASIIKDLIVANSFDPNYAMGDYELPARAVYFGTRAV